MTDLTGWFIRYSLYTTTITTFLVNGIIQGTIENTQYDQEMNDLKDYGLYYSFNKTKEILMKYYEKSDSVKKLVDEFDFRCSNSKFYFQKKFPFITIEGAYRRNRNIVAQKLGKKMKARTVGNPPQFMIMSNYFFNDTTELRRAFYSLGVHAAACKVREYLTTSAVIVPGYWIDQASFGIAKMFHTLPLPTSRLYEWPQELIKPDKVYLINPISNYAPIPLHPYKPMLTYTFKDKMIEAMKRFRNPAVTEVNSTTNCDDIVKVIVKCINSHFNTFYNV